ncbi:MAG: adenosine kinase [Pseudomonadota bacterium]
MTHQFDVIAIGNAIVDVLAPTDDDFLKAHDIPKGGMMLIDTQKASEITSALQATDQVAGGSAGNTVACLASLGGRAAFVGKVADDNLGQVYRDSMQEIGVDFSTPPLKTHPPTGRCLIAVTPDAERSMATYLGAAGHVSSDDVIQGEIELAAVTYFEGYLFEGEAPRSAFIKACDIARAAGRKTALTLSDVGVVERNRDALLSFIEGHVDLVFANEEEARALFGNHDDAASLAKAMKELVDFGAVTQSEKGSIVYGPNSPAEEVPAVMPPQLVDTTGAGDAYAGGFLYGFTRDMPLAKCAHLGSLAASEVISHMGPRPERALRELAVEKSAI